MEAQMTEEQFMEGARMYDPANSPNETEFLRNKLRIALLGLITIRDEGDAKSKYFAKSSLYNMGELSRLVFEMFPEIGEKYPVRDFETNPFYDVKGGSHE
jgi:uncharacterized protein (DUF169 family)